MAKIVFLSGAGISAESGIKTFRDADGLWEGHDVMEVASPEGWKRNMTLVLDFYNQRRRQLLEVKPNSAHIAIAGLQEDHEVHVITQNVDDLHERAGSRNVIHLHGELLKVRSVSNPSLVYDWTEDLNLNDKADDGSQLRPDIVWFGEQVPKLTDAAQILPTADVVVVIGTSMQVYPAASLISYADPQARKFYIDPKPTISYEISSALNMEVIPEIATVGMSILLQKLQAVK